MGRPARAMVASRMIALAAAWRWISVSITSGASRVKVPSLRMGGQLAGISEHEDRLAEAHQVARDLRADHRHLVENDQPGVGGVALRVQGEARVLDGRESLAHCRDRDMVRGAREPRETARVAFGERDLTDGVLDLFLGRKGCGAGLAVDGACGLALAGQHQRGLADEGGGAHAGHAKPFLSAAVGRGAEFVERKLQHGGLPGTGVAEEAEHPARYSVRVSNPSLSARIAAACMADGLKSVMAAARRLTRPTALGKQRQGSKQLVGSMEAFVSVLLAELISIPGLGGLLSGFLIRSLPIALAAGVAAGILGTLVPIIVRVTGVGATS